LTAQRCARPRARTLSTFCPSFISRHSRIIPIVIHRREHDPEIAPTLGASIDMARVGKTEAAALMSVVHQVLGYRPPPGSLAVTAQAAAKLHSDTGEGMDRATLADAAREDATCVRDE
jgi:hypothetical protein